MTANRLVFAAQLLIGLAPGESAWAQWGHRFSAAAGPAIVVDDSPPYAGASVRAAASLWPGPRTLNFLADGYFTWLAPGSRELRFTGGSLESRLRETQLGVGLSALVALSRARAVSPYLLAGGVYRWSDVAGSETLRDESGQVVDQVEFDLTEDQLDILLGLGAAIRAGTRRVLIEARLYGGVAIYLPITVGLTF